MPYIRYKEKEEYEGSFSGVEGMLSLRFIVNGYYPQKYILMRLQQYILEEHLHTNILKKQYNKNIV
jgi:hypothetical protein